MAPGYPPPVPPPTGKRATWAELFFDLVFVFAVTQVAHLLHQHHGLGMAVLVLTPMYWAWVGTTIYANRRDVEHRRHMLGCSSSGWRSS